MYLIMDDIESTTFKKLLNRYDCYKNYGRFQLDMEFFFISEDYRFCHWVNIIEKNLHEGYILLCEKLI